MPAVPADDPDADVVVFAVCVDVLDVSPGNWAGISGSADALPFAVPVAPPPEAVPCEDGMADVVTLKGSDVWACAIENPRRTARAKMNVRCIVLSRRKKHCHKNNSRSIKKENEFSESSG